MPMTTTQPDFRTLTAEQKKARVQAELASRVLAKRSLLHFTQRMNPNYKAGWVHADVCRRLEKFSLAVHEGRSPRLLLMMPPRAGKSELASKIFPAWHLGHYADHEFIACSYNVSLAMTFSRKAQALLEDPAYKTVFDTRLDPNHKSIEEWTLLGASGGFVAAGVGGGITGKGAHILSIDDPFKNSEDADNPDLREKLWDWYGSTAYTRLSPGGGVLVTQTCWHDDDLAGRIQAKMLKEPDFDRFEIIKYPAIAEAFEFVDSQTDEIVRVAEAADREAAFDSAVEHGHTALSLKHLRDKGDALHPERYDIKKLLQIKRTLTARHWSALYQQNPVPEDGQFFLAHQFQRRMFPQKERCNVNVAFDFAISTKTVNDYTVGSVGLQDETDHLHVVEMIRFRSSDVYFLVEQLLSLVARWYTPTLILGVEDGQIWRSMSAVLKKRMQEKRQHFVIKVLPPLTDKRARASVLQARMEQGMVSFNPVGEWYDIAKAELLRFDNGVHDDCVDSLGWMARLAQARQPPKPVGARPLKSWKDNLNAFVRGSEAGPMAA